MMKQLLFIAGLALSVAVSAQSIPVRVDSVWGASTTWYARARGIELTGLPNANNVAVGDTMYLHDGNYSLNIRRVDSVLSASSNTCVFRFAGTQPNWPNHGAIVAPGEFYTYSPDMPLDAASVLDKFFRGRIYTQEGITTAGRRVQLGTAWSDTTGTILSSNGRRIVATGDAPGEAGNYMSQWRLSPYGWSVLAWNEDGGRNFTNGGATNIGGKDRWFGVQVLPEDSQVTLSARDEISSPGINTLTVLPDRTEFTKKVEYDSDVSAGYTARSLVDKGYITATSQPLDADLTAIAALTPSTGQVLKWSGGWTAGTDAGAFTATDNQLLYSVSNTPTGSTAFTADPTNYLLTVTGNGSATNTAQNRLVLSTNSTGTPATGLGSALLFQGESSTTENRDMAQISAVWTDVTDAGRDASLVFSSVNNGTVTNRVWITNAGYLGIGQSGPGSSLSNTSSVFGDGTNNVSVTGVTWNVSAVGGYSAGFRNASTSGHGLLAATAGTTSTQRAFTVCRNNTTPTFSVFGNGQIDTEGVRLFFSTTTQETNYVLANSTGTNVNLGLVPKGTGGIVADIPDATSAGGNARGLQALDLQFNRSAATEVASGTESAIISGQQNTASGTRSTAIGAFQSTASGEYSWVQGNALTASADYAVASGNAALAADYGQEARSTGTISTAGDAQVSRMVLRKAITGMGTSELYANGTNQRCRVPSGRAFNATVQLVATCDVVGNGSGITVGETFIGTFEVGLKNNGGETALVGSVQNLHTAQADTGMSTASVSITADNTNDALSIIFQPPSTAGTTTVIHVVATVVYTQVGF